MPEPVVLVVLLIVAVVTSVGVGLIVVGLERV